MEEKPNYYAIIPAEVRYDKDLKPNEKLLYGEITSLMNKEGYCYASNKYFSNLYGVSVVSISDWINNLVKKNYLETEMIYKENSKEILYRKITLPLLKKSLIGIKENFKGGIKENFKGNNKDIIINNNREIYIEEIEKWKPILTPNDFEIINKIVENFTIEQVREAIPICEYNNARSLKYLIQVLTNPRREKTIVAKKSGINPSWLNEDLQETPMNENELKELQKEFEEFL